MAISNLEKGSPQAVNLCIELAVSSDHLAGLSERNMKIVISQVSYATAWESNFYGLVGWQSDLEKRWNRLFHVSLLLVSSCIYGVI